MHGLHRMPQGASGEAVDISDGDGRDAGSFFRDGEPT